MPGPIPHLLKRWNLALRPKLDKHTVLISMEKESKCTAIFSAHTIFCISIYRVIKCTAKSQFENDVRQIPQCKSHIEINALLSTLFLLNGQPPYSWNCGIKSYPGRIFRVSLVAHVT